MFFDPTSEIQKNNLAGTKSNWPLKIVNSLAAAQLTSQGERMFHGDRSQKIHEETRQEKMQKNGFWCLMEKKIKICRILDNHDP